MDTSVIQEIGVDTSEYECNTIGVNTSSIKWIRVQCNVYMGGGVEFHALVTG